MLLTFQENARCPAVKMSRRVMRGWTVGQQEVWSLPKEKPGSFVAHYLACFVSDNSYRLFSRVSWATFMLETCVRL